MSWQILYDGENFSLNALLTAVLLCYVSGVSGECSDEIFTLLCHCIALDMETVESRVLSIAFSDFSSFFSGEHAQCNQDFRFNFAFFTYFAGRT